ncbi:hypothetical protein [Vibrio barjaei]|uniref:hypothetical protein n=1 Tax=Vibrio barjaei TaxID=1676683 RepID=UPI002284D8D8|nr:hypothetical protein [Vibrio barjaei]MCY9872956.1 hypothetical protein [Vibrio barjaei]
MKKNRFYKTSPYSHVGSNVSFYGIDNKGYVTDLDKAHIYTREEAQKEVDNGELRHENLQELFLSADHVNDLSIWQVDTQYISKKYPEFTDPNNEYVACRKGVWNGNDVGFAATISHNFDYSQARVFTEQEVKAMDIEGWFIVPKFHTDEIARRTFQFPNINRRKMISSAGIVGIRKKRPSRSTGRTRWNCPECGKIVWQHDPHTFMSCVDMDCKEYDGYLAACR